MAQWLDLQDGTWRWRFPEMEGPAKIDGLLDDLGVPLFQETSN